MILSQLLQACIFMQALYYVQSRIYRGNSGLNVKLTIRHVVHLVHMYLWGK
jgi:hypothetical protein